MPHQNRVTPLGDLIATPARGLVYGNRGCLHDEDGRIRCLFASKRWIACRLEFKGRRRTSQLQPGRYTELYFLDEATAPQAIVPARSAGAEDYDRIVALLGMRADATDERLHAERLEATVGAGCTGLRRRISDGASSCSPTLSPGSSARTSCSATRRRGTSSPASYRRGRSR